MKIEAFREYAPTMDTDNNKIIDEDEFAGYLPENMEIESHDKMYSSFFTDIESNPKIVNEIKNSVLGEVQEENKEPDNEQDDSKGPGEQQTIAVVAAEQSSVHKKSKEPE